MRIRNRSIIIMLSQGLTQATTLILGIILVRMVSQHTLGTYRQVILVYMFLAGIISLQLDNSLYYFVPKLGLELRRTLLVQTFLVTIVMALVVAVIMYFGAGFIARFFGNNDLVPLIRIFALYPFVERLLILIPAFMISIDRPLRAGMYSLAASAGRIAAVVMVLFLGYSLSAVMWAVVLVGAIVALSGCLDMVRLSPQGRWRMDSGLVREQFNYSWPLLVTAVAGTINIELNKILVSAYFDSDIYGIYSCGAMQLPVISMVTVSLSAAMMPNLVNLVKKNKTLEALNIWQEAARKCSLIIFPCFVFFMVTGYDFIVLVYTQDYAQASWPFRIYLCALPMRVAICATLFRAVGSTRPIAVGAFIAMLINAVLSITLIVLGDGGFLSFVGPMIGTVIASWGAWFYMLWKLISATNVSFMQIMRWKELAGTMLVCVVCGAAIFVMPLSGLPLAVKLCLQAIFYIVSFLLIMLSAGMLQRDEKQMLRWPFALVIHIVNKLKGIR